MSLVPRLQRDMHRSRSSSNVPRLPSFLEMLENPHVLLTFGKVRNPLRLPRKTTSEPSKVVQACGALNILTWKCASRHSGVHFFEISTSKSGPRMVCFVNFDLEMCFAPTPCTFSTSQLPKMVRTWCALYILTWKRASRHNGAHFFDFVTSRRGPKLTFSSLIWPDGSAPTALQIIGKHSDSRLFYLFARLHLVSSDSFSSLIFSLLPFSDSSCFSICPYCRKFHF